MPWVKGLSGNPKGRPPKGKAMTDELRKVLALKDENGIPLMYAIAYQLGRLSAEGNVEAIKYVFDRIDGKPLEQEPDSSPDRVTNVYIDGMKLGDQRPPGKSPETEGPA